MLEERRQHKRFLSGLCCCCCCTFAFFLHNPDSWFHHEVTRLIIFFYVKCVNIFLLKADRFTEMYLLLIILEMKNRVYNKTVKADHPTGNNVLVLKCSSSSWGFTPTVFHRCCVLLRVEGTLLSSGRWRGVLFQVVLLHNNGIQVEFGFGYFKHNVFWSSPTCQSATTKTQVGRGNDHFMSLN